MYAVLGSSKDLAVGTVAVGSLLTGAMLSKEVDAEKDPKLYLHLAFTATFFAGVLEASLGIFRFILMYLYMVLQETSLPEFRFVSYTLDPSMWTKDSGIKKYHTR